VRWIRAACLVVKDTWDGSIRMNAQELRQLTGEGVSSRLEATAQIAESDPRRPGTQPGRYRGLAVLSVPCSPAADAGRDRQEARPCMMID